MPCESCVNVSVPVTMSLDRTPANVNVHAPTTSPPSEPSAGTSAVKFNVLRVPETTALNRGPPNRPGVVVHPSHETGTNEFDVSPVPVTDPSGAMVSVSCRVPVASSVSRHTTGLIGSAVVIVWEYGPENAPK